MKQICRRLLLIVCFAGGVVASGQENRSAAESTGLPAEYTFKEWKEVSSAEGGFKVLFPGTPAEQIQFFDTEVGRLKNGIYVLQTAVATYVVAYDDLAPFSSDPETIKRMLDGGRDKAVDSGEGTLLIERDISVDGFPGREIVAEIREGLLRTRVCLVKQRFYQVIIITPQPRTLSAEKTAFYESIARRFLDSFKLTARAGTEGKR